jgi:O-antigen/teichoic acid export membrane protein
MYLKKALQGTAIVFIFTVLAGVSWYLFRFMLARNLTLYEFGLFYAILAFLSFFNLFVDAGFSQAVPKFIVDFKAKNNNAGVKKVILMSLAFQLFVSLFLFLLVFLFSNFLSANYFHSDVGEYLLLMGIWFITVPFSYFYGYLFTGFQKYGLGASIEVVRVVLTLIVSFLLFRLNFGFYSPILAYAAINIILVIVYLPFSSRLLKFKESNSKKPKTDLKFDSKLFSSLIKFGVFVSFSSIIWVVLSQVDTLMLTFFSGVEAVGLYQSAVPLASIAMYFITAVTVVSYPMSSELYAKKKFAELKAGINLFYKYILLILVPCLMILFAFSGSIIYVLFGEKFVSASIALKILSIGAIFSSLTLFNNNIISAIGKPKEVAKMMLFVAITNVVLCLILIPLFGVNGAATATASSFLVGAIVSLKGLNKNIKTKIPVFDWIKTLFAGVLMIVFIDVIKSQLAINSIIGFVILGVAALAIYALLCFVMGILDIKEIKYFMRNMVKK